MRFTRRHLPHVDAGVATYFVTARLRAKPLTSDETSLLRRHIVSGCRPFCELLALQVMPDHVHLLFQTKPDLPLRRVMKGIKGTTARVLNRKRGTRGSVWQEESFDRIVRNEKEFKEKIRYMFLNPVKARLTEKPEEYVGWYLNRDAM